MNGLGKHNKTKEIERGEIERGKRENLRYLFTIIIGLVWVTEERT